MPRVWLLLLFALAAGGCRPDLVVGSWLCAESSGVPDAGDGGSTPDATQPITVPWATGFEDGFCGFARAGGYCYSNTDASYDLVTSPVHSGRRAAAFTVTADPARDGLQARCVRRGTLPTDAVYGAWYYVPAPATNTDNWNLMHFQGAAGISDSLWDISFGNGADGSLYLYVFDFLRGSVRAPNPVVPVPIGSWFHLEFRWLRATDATGAIAVYQDGRPLLELSGLVTDDSESAEWYVGNLADALSPPDSTLYVDDISIRAAP